MSSRSRSGRVGAIGASAAALLVYAAPAAAKESRRAVCTAAVESYMQAVASQKAGRLRAARDQYLSCAEVKACAGLAPKCQAAADKIAAQMPSVVPFVTDGSGNALIDVEVNVDGQPFASHLDGRGLPIEVGGHEFTFAIGGRVFATQRVLVVEGERNRRVSVSTQPADSGATAEGPPAPRAALPPAKERPAAEATSGKPDTDPEETHASAPAEGRVGEEHWAMPTSVGPYLVATVGLAAVGGGALLTMWGNKDNDQAVAQCNRTCPPSTADHIRSLYTWADVSYGVGIAGLALATWMIARSHTSETPPSKAATTLDVAPTRAGAVAGVRGTF